MIPFSPSRGCTEDGRATAKVERYAIELSQRLEQLVLDDSCEARWRYSIFDDRANTPAAAAPGVIGTP
jgi:hypothetical protein